VLVRPDATAPPTVTAAPFARVERADPGTGWRIGERVRFGAWIRTGGGGLALRGPRDVSLRLAHGSRLLPIGPERVRLEDGALYVDSRAASLAVETPHGTVTDVGTQFEARLAGAALAVRVRDGRVRVVADDRTWEAAAGEEVELASGAVARRRIAPDDEAWAWVEALAQPPAIEGRPLLAFLEWVGRERGLRLAFANGDAARRAAELRLHGDLSDLSVGEALEAVMATTGFSARVRAGALVVDGPPRR
jgi:ferric-dicitrate binding protein FerR (iron transport regulator)